MYTCVCGRTREMHDGWQGKTNASRLDFALLCVAFVSVSSVRGSATRCAAKRRGGHKGACPGRQRRVVEPHAPHRQATDLMPWAIESASLAANRSFACATKLSFSLSPSSPPFLPLPLPLHPSPFTRARAAAAAAAASASSSSSSLCLFSLCAAWYTFRRAAISNSDGASPAG